VEDYSKMRLTYETDRLVAFDGIIPSLHTHHHDRCFRGVWESQAIQHLVWWRIGTPIGAARCQTANVRSVCPTWSWATLGKSVEFPLEHPEPFRGSDCPLCTKNLAPVVCFAEVQPETTRSVVTKIRGFVEQLEAEIDDSDSEYLWYGMDDNWQAYRITALTCSTGEQVQIRFDDPSSRLAHGPQKLRCLLLVRRKGEDPDGETVYFIIVKTTKQRPRSYRRIGLGYVRSITKEILEEQDFTPVQAFRCLDQSGHLSRRVIKLQ
jgi:hypothetical protein